MALTDEQREYIQYKIDGEGLDYTFQHYSHFEDVDDVEFHRLRQAYVEAAKALEDYVGYDPDKDEDLDFDTDSDAGDEDDYDEDDD